VPITVGPDGAIVERHAFVAGVPRQRCRRKKLARPAKPVLALIIRVLRDRLVGRT